MTFLKGLTLLTTLSISGLSFGEIPKQKDINDPQPVANYSGDFKSYWDSEYFKANPNILAYDKCYINVASASAGLIIGFNSSHNTTIDCTSKKLNTKFTIPIALEKERTYGLVLNFGANVGMGSLSGLTTRTLTDLFGNYSGIHGGFAIKIFGASGSYLTHNGIKFKAGEWSGLFKIALGYRQMNIVPRFLKKNEIYTNDYLKKETKLLKQTNKTDSLDFLALEAQLKEMPNEEKFRKTYLMSIQSQPFAQIIDETEQEGWNFKVSEGLTFRHINPE